MTSVTCKTRFAPSPSGLLHLGNVRTALFNVLLARRQEGVFLLRIEDTDATRSQDEYIQAVMEDLQWLGLHWQEGPQAIEPIAPGNAPAPQSGYRQSQRLAVYGHYFNELIQRSLAYPCFCTDTELKLARKTMLAAGQPPRYSGRCYRLNPDEAQARLKRGEAASLRFHVPAGRRVQFEDQVRGPQEFLSDDIGDFVVRRSDGTPAFFFSNAVDDALMGVTLVLRGEDHLTNTPRQILLLQALELPVPAYAHIALVVGDDGAPLSKRHGSRSVRELRAAGFFPQAINNYLARLGHVYADNALLDLAGLAAGFSMERLGRAPARYDATQLLHWQREAIHQAPDEELWHWMGEQVRALVGAERASTFIAAVRSNITLPEDALKWARIVFSEDWQASGQAQSVMAGAGTTFYTEAQRALAQHPADFKAWGAQLAVLTGVKGRALFQPLRAALTGELDGPEMAQLLPLIGPKRAQARLQKAANR